LVSNNKTKDLVEIYLEVIISKPHHSANSRLLVDLEEAALASSNSSNSSLLVKRHKQALGSQEALVNSSSPNNQVLVLAGLVDNNKLPQED
jgi:hypothetical protein